MEAAPTSTTTAPPVLPHRSDSPVSAPMTPALPHRPHQGDRSPDSVYKFVQQAGVGGIKGPLPATGGPQQDPRNHPSDQQSLTYSSHDDYNNHHDGSGDSETYLALQSLDGDDGASVQTGHYANHRSSAASSHASDATQAIHEMHLALLYLLSHPEEFQSALPLAGGAALAAWNAECDAESTASASVYSPLDPSHRPPPHSPAGTFDSASPSTAAADSHPPPLPFAIFADDAEVVLPQAHTVSQLFGVEVTEGIELEAASGIAAISQLFLRWLALMPGGDHLNLIDPPGLTVMRIAGGRYRVTAAHRVVWTWMNAIAGNPLQPGDLVTMTIVDVFETDSQGKLLSYCPTFDNRAIHKTHPAAESLRKSSTRLASALQHQSKVGRLWVHKASHLAQSVQRQIRSGSRPGTAASSASASPGRRSHSHELALDLPEDTDRHEV